MTSQLDVRQGSQEPTLLHLPADGIEGAGAEAIELARECGIVLDPWQELVVNGFLLERPNRQWAATQGVCEVPRQNGKNVIQEVIEIAGLLLFGERLITHSAHLFVTATEHFLHMREHFETVPLLAELVDAMPAAHGFESIVLRGGQRLKFFARSLKGGRGFTGDRVVFDEAFSLSGASLGAMVPALSARSMEVPGPQILYFSSPAHSDSAVLHRLRNIAIKGDDPRLAYFGWLNPPGTARGEVDSLYAVNPGLGIRITEEWAAETELATLPPEEYDRERLGIPSAEDSGATVFGAGKWLACADERSGIPEETVPSLALVVGPEMNWSSFAAAGRRADKKIHIEIVDRRQGTGWVVDRAKELTERWHVPIVVNPKSPVSGLLDEFAKQNIPVDEVSGVEYAAACATLQNAVQNGSVRHMKQEPLDDAVVGAAIRSIGETWVWHPRAAALDITPLGAVTLAFARASKPSLSLVDNVW